MNESHYRDVIEKLLAKMNDQLKQQSDRIDYLDNKMDVVIDVLVKIATDLRHQPESVRKYIDKELNKGK